MAEISLACEVPEIGFNLERTGGPRPFRNGCVINAQAPYWGIDALVEAVDRHIPPPSGQCIPQNLRKVIVQTEHYQNSPHYQALTDRIKLVSFVSVENLSKAKAVTGRLYEVQLYHPRQQPISVDIFKPSFRLPPEDQHKVRLTPSPLTISGFTVVIFQDVPHSVLLRPR